jgi:hypothetical protein
MARPKQLLQNDFSGGEISSRMLLRHDNPAYSKSLLTMLNWIPTMQGTAERAPGSQYVLDTGVPWDARIIPYRSVSNDRGIIQLTQHALDFRTGVNDLASQDRASTGADKQIVVNSDLGRGTTGEWSYSPEQYVGGSGDKLGMLWGGGVIRGNCREYKYPTDINFMVIRTTAVVDVPSDSILLEYALLYDNFFVDGGYDLVVSVGTTLDGDDVWVQTWDDPEDIPPTTIKTDAPLPAGYTGELFVRIFMRALATPEQRYSGPNMALNYFRIWAAAEAPPADISLNTNYLAGELADIHYVASPYDTTNPIKAQKPIIFCHPNHPPSWFYWDGDLGAYAFAPITFTNEPTEWTTQANNFPSTCTAVQGRLVLGGCPTDSETVWMTRVTEWNEFDDLLSLTDVTPEDSIEFTTIYRSPIQWLSGHKNLLVGTDEIEYLASADGIFQPSDLGVEVQTTHGGAHVQPVGFGPAVLFAAEAGTKVRQASFSTEESGYVAPDLTIWHPDLCASGIVRMVRMRNPHQMLAAVLGNGQLAILHLDTYAQIMGWTRVSLNAKVIDACVLVDDKGFDVLYVLVRRNVNGAQKLYLEAFSDWTDFNNQQYLSSHVVQINTGTPTNVITGLEHLEGAICQVVGDEEYIGSFLVTGGQITLETQVGVPVNVSKSVVGRSMVSTMVTLPPPSLTPSSKKRYTDVSVRVRGSTKTIINGERVKDRAPSTLMDTSEPLSLVNDHTVYNLGQDAYQLITIEETVPYRSEVLGISGTLQENSV